MAILLRPESDPWRIADVLDRVETIAGQLSDAAALRRPLAGFRPDVVYHLGWSGSGHTGRNDRASQSENVTDAVALVELAAHVGATAWIGLGSQAENGPTALVLDESTPVRPTSAYGAAKLLAATTTRELCAARGLRHSWLRLLTAYGPAEDPSYLVPQVILSLLRGSRPALTEGHQPGDFLHVTDAASALRAVALNESCAGTFVLSSGHHRPVRDIALALRDLIDPRLELGFGEIVPKDPPLGLRGNPRALELATGWSPKVSLEAGLAECVGWYRQNLGRYSKVQT